MAELHFDPEATAREHGEEHLIPPNVAPLARPTGPAEVATHSTEVIDSHGTDGGPQPHWPAPLAQVAYHGLAGEFVNLVLPHSEADPVALLAQFLVGFGSLIGRGPHFRTEADKHYTNLYAVLVGETSKGRKGTAWGHVREQLQCVDADWSAHCIQSGLSSGEGLIWAVRDPIHKREPIQTRKGGRVTGYQDIETDAGVSDKRLLVVQTEFASVTAVMEREGNTLSAIIRQGWDSGELRVMNKNSPATATGAHISLIGHITADELRRTVARTELGNGFANRIVWICVKRSKVLPDGGALETVDLSYFVTRLRAAVEFAKTLRDTELKRDDGARALWHAVYEDLSDGKPGLLGAVTSRAEAQAMRLALVYALLDCSIVVKRAHLEAGLALWQYAEASARFTWGDSLGDPVADEILRALRIAGAMGSTRTEVSGVFGRNRGASEIGRALNVLAALRLVRCEKEKTNGRDAERWYAVGPTKETK